MIEITSDTRVIISVTPIDLRAGINRLGAITTELFGKDPMKGGIYLFHNKSKTNIRLVCYDRNGFFIGHKRFSRGKLSWWPWTEGETLSITVDQLNRLLKGIDPWGSFNPQWESLRDGKNYGAGKSDSGGFQLFPFTPGKSTAYPKDIASLLSILNVFVSLRQLVEKRKLGLLKLLRQLFGFNTEKKDQKQKAYTAGPDAPADSGGCAGRDDYHGADREKIEHETLKPKDQCPECLKGGLTEAEDGIEDTEVGDVIQKLNATCEHVTNI